MIRLLIGLLFLAALVYVSYLVLGLIPLPGAIRQIAVIVLALIFLVVLLKKSGIAGGGDWY